ncbi:TIGR03085 family metal-binding protein [Paeniglutamicibacter sp. NPDC091659]|uniref:TIGR03085 family metal-binding protein n=1 Tax=Paeniglutamicibacter sp. NPDC091659 TaxID=3364389 RepID=UPI0038221757
MHFVPASREVLAEVLLAAGPTAPTLCAGWQTRHLAAHLVLREHSMLSAGLALKPLASAMERELKSRADRARDNAAYAELVHEFVAGAPRFSPFALPAFDRAANLSEYFIHTEDVRRATDRWAPRVLDEKYAELLWRDLVRRASAYYRGSEVGIILVLPDGRRHVARKAKTSVAIMGRPEELLLHAAGRREEALVTFEGADEALELFNARR